jgi:hypothetical protein
MSTTMTTHTRMERLALRIASSSDARVLNAHFAPCVLDLLDQSPPRAHVATEVLI